MTIQVRKQTLSKKYWIMGYKRYHFIYFRANSVCVRILIPIQLLDATSTFIYMFWAADTLRKHEKSNKSLTKKHWTSLLHCAMIELSRDVTNWAHNDS